jgi:hypothetical protein
MSELYSSRGPNPLYTGLRIKDRDDFFPLDFTQEALNNIFENIGWTAHDIGLLCEAPTLEEADDYYNPGEEVVDDSFILEAITVDRFSRTEKRMKAVVRVLNRYLSGEEITALDPVVGRPKKSGSFAYVTVQLPFSDGQVVTIVFHSPEGDKKRITPSDTIIAFRWLLNKRDITHVVAPEDGEEISLESIGRRITRLVVKNSARFERTQKEAVAERKELEQAKETQKAEEARQDGLMESIVAEKDASDALDAKISSRSAELERQKQKNAELEAKLAALKAEKESTDRANGKSSGQDAGEKGQRQDENEKSTPGNPPAFVDTMKDILAGKHDADTDLVGNLLDQAAEDAEIAGLFAEYEGLFNNVADRLTSLLKKRAA